MRNSWKLVIVILSLVSATLWIALLFYPDSYLNLTACNVGQGDSILLHSRNSQILVDGGPNDEVLKCLSNHMPFWDRGIELLVLTHPDKDHYDGLIDVLRYYDVESILISDYNNDTEGYRLFKKVVQDQKVKLIPAKSGLSLRLSEINIKVLHPENNSRKFVLGSVDSKNRLNDHSVVLSINYGSFDALLTGDIGPKISDRIAAELSNEYEYLKVPHHGSKNGLSELLLQRSSPEVAVISAGKNNRFGHPHSEIINLLDSSGVETLRTDIDGEITVSSDGETYWINN